MVQQDDLPPAVRRPLIGPGTRRTGRGPDPTEESRWGPLWRLLATMDHDIARLYQERGIDEIRPRFVKPLVRISRYGPMTIQELADATGVTHSAMSQTVSALRRAGLVTSTPGADARTRTIGLTERAASLVPLLEAEWRATERALAELEAEIPYALSQVVRDIEAALARRSFHDRIVEQLTATAEPLTAPVERSTGQPAEQSTTPAEQTTAPGEQSTAPPGDRP